MSEGIVKNPLLIQDKKQGGNYTSFKQKEIKNGTILCINGGQSGFFYRLGIYDFVQCSG